VNGGGLTLGIFETEPDVVWDENGKEVRDFNEMIRRKLVFVTSRAEIKRHANKDRSERDAKGEESY
jgi:hypothetical protein